MNNKTVILIGFSTAGKSYYLNKIAGQSSYQITTLDSDQIVSTEYGDHIYNIFMECGHEQAINYIEIRERKFIQDLNSANNKPTLVAAGPFLVIRDGWQSYIEEKQPLVFYLKKSAESIYSDLEERKLKQKKILDINNPNFGSWDLDVTTEWKNGVYRDIEKELALENIRMHLSRIEPIYERYGKKIFDSDQLKNNMNESEGFIQTILDYLR